MTELKKFHEARVLEAVCRTDFGSFTEKCFRSLNPGTEFLPNWHIDAMAHHLELVRLGKIKRLIINVPPRTLKSLTSSVAYPAFVLGHGPTKRLIVVSYGSDGPSGVVPRLRGPHEIFQRECRKWVQDGSGLARSVCKASKATISEQFHCPPDAHRLKFHSMRSGGSGGPESIRVCSGAWTLSPR
jgi:hypothetical protein